MKVGEDGRAGMPELVDALGENDAAAGEHEDSDKEPDGERLLGAGIDVMWMRSYGLRCHVCFLTRARG